MGNSSQKSKPYTPGAIKYLFIDLVSILEGCITAENHSENDLFIKQIDATHSRILKNGVKILDRLNWLVEEFGYSIVFHSSHKEKQQFDSLEGLNAACDKRGIKHFPRVLAMSVRDSSLYKNIDAANPIMIKNRSYNISLACYGRKQDGKICARIALSKLLDIKENDRKRHIIIDDDPSVIVKSTSEGWNVYDTKVSSLSQIIQNIYLKEWNIKNGSNQGLGSNSVVSKIKFKELGEERPKDWNSSLIRLFLNEVDNTKWAGKCSMQAVGRFGPNKEPILPDYYDEYNEYVSNKIYDLFGVNVPEVLLSEQMLNKESQMQFEAPDPKTPRLHIMSRYLENFKELGSAFIVDYQTKNSEDYFTIEGQPLAGIGRCLAVAHFLNELNCMGNFGEKIGYICESEKNKIVKILCNDALYFPDVLAEFAYFKDNPETLNNLITNSNIPFDQLNDSDQKEFAKTIKAIMDSSSQSLRFIFEPIIDLDNRFQSIFEKLLERKSKLLETFSLETIQTLSKKIDEIQEKDEQEELSEEDEPIQKKGTSNSMRSQVEGRRYKMIFDDSKNSITFQIPKPTKYFAGRKNELDQMKKFFETDKPILCLTGNSGLGKSELVAKFISQESYSSIIWLKAEQDILFTQIQLYMQARFNTDLFWLDKTKLVHAFYQNLILHKGDQNKKVCIVIDDANSQEEIAPYLPNPEHQLHFNVLITSRFENWISITTIKLKPFENYEIDELLRKKLEFKEPTALNMFNTILEGLPLCIIQASSYIQHNQMSLQEFCDLFEKQSESQALELGDSEIRVISRVLNLALSKITEKRPNVDDLLSILAYISPNDISKPLLRKYYDYLDDFEDILQLLLGYSIIYPAAVESEYKIHRLTQSALRLNYIKNGTFDKYFERIYNLLLPQLNYKEGNLEDAQRVSLLIPHAAALAELKSDIEPTVISELLQKIALHQHYAAGNYQMALKYYQRALQINETFYGKEHLQTASILINLANVWGCLGKYEMKKDMLKLGADITEKQLGKDHPKTAIILINLANAYGSLGDFQSKRDLLTKALEIIQAKYGKGHPRTGITLANLGSAYLKLKGYEKAYNCQTKAYRIFHKYYGEENKHTKFSAAQLRRIEEARSKN